MLTGNKLPQSSAIMGNWAETVVPTVLDEGSELLVARFSGRLQLEARISSKNNNLVYQNFADQTKRWEWNPTTSTISPDQVSERLTAQLYKDSPHKKEHNWGWTGKEYRSASRQHSARVPGVGGMGLQTSYFYTALWDLVIYLDQQNHPFIKNGKSTMVFLTDTEYYDDTPKKWEDDDNAAWDRKMGQSSLNRRHRSDSSERYDELRQTPADVCNLLRRLSKVVDRMIFFHSREGGTVMRQKGLNKSQFIMERLFDYHVHTDCQMADVKFDLSFPTDNMNLEDLKASTECGMGFDDLLCCPSLRAGPYALTRVKNIQCNQYVNEEHGIRLYNSYQGWVLVKDEEIYMPRERAVQDACCPKLGHDDYFQMFSESGRSSFALSCDDQERELTCKNLG